MFSNVATQSIKIVKTLKHQPLVIVITHLQSVGHPHSDDSQLDIPKPQTPTEAESWVRVLALDLLVPVPVIPVRFTAPSYVYY